MRRVFCCWNAPDHLHGATQELPSVNNRQNKARMSRAKFLFYMVGPAGFEPATKGLWVSQFETHRTT